MNKRHGRSKPYTSQGIRRLPCCRCGSPSRFQWQMCADNRLFRPLCLECDVALNKLILTWLGDPEVEEKINNYRLHCSVCVQ